MNKQSQITPFIILGVFILLGGVAFFTIRSEMAEKETAAPVTVSEQVPIEFDSVKVYIENCLTKTAMEGLKVLGERGGYIEPLMYGFSAGSEVTEGSAIQWANNWLMPYWWHLKSDNDCEETCEFELTPEGKLFLYKTSGSPSIEEQLGQYVDEHLNDCLADFRTLKTQGYTIKELDKPKTTVMVVDKAVYFGLEYPIEAFKQSKKTISKFATRIDVDIKTIYELAGLLTSLEANYHYLEYYTLDLIAGFSGVDKELPPMTQTTFRLSRNTWSKQEVYEQLHQNVLPYIQLFGVWGTYNNELYSFPDDAYREAFYNGNMMIPGNATYNELAVEFDYLGWQPYFDLNCDGDECSPDSVIFEIMQLFGVQHYYFLYDLSFPVLVTIRDPNAFLFDEEKGYTFNFLLEGNIRNNEPMTTDYVTIEASAFSESSMLCDADKRNSGDITLNVKDTLTNENLEEVQVVYTCAGESCSMGETDSGGNLVSKFPICFNGIVSFMKDDYITYSIILTTNEDSSASFDVSLTPILTKQFTVKKALMEKLSGGFTPVWDTITSPVSLSSNEHALITLTRKTSLNEMPFSAYAEFIGNESYGEIRIAPGDYEMKIDIWYYDTFEIPKRTEEIEGESITYPAIVFNDTNPLNNGGLHCENTSHAFSVTNPNFNSESIIVFKALSPNLPGIAESEREIADLEEIGKLDDTEYTQYCYSLSPENKNE